MSKIANSQAAIHIAVTYNWCNIPCFMHCRLMKDVSTREQNNIAADLLSNMIEWSFIKISPTGNNLKSYDKDLNYKIEMAFRNKLPSVQFS